MATNPASEDAMCLIYSTFPDEQTAREIAANLLDQQLIACANMLSSMRAIYRWEGKVAEDAEIAVIFKTSMAAAGEVEAAIEKLHPYDVPAIIRIDASANTPFAQWVNAETST